MVVGCSLCVVCCLLFGICCNVVGSSFVVLVVRRLTSVACCLF